MSSEKPIFAPCVLSSSFAWLKLLPLHLCLAFSNTMDTRHNGPSSQWEAFHEEYCDPSTLRKGDIVYYDHTYDGLQICVVQIEDIIWSYRQYNRSVMSFILNAFIPGGDEICARVTVQEFETCHRSGVLKFSRFSQEVPGAGAAAAV